MAAMLLGAIAAGAGLAADAPDTGREVARREATIAAANREIAKVAQETAAAAAARAVSNDNRLDLDIRLVGPTSMKIASRF